VSEAAAAAAASVRGLDLPSTARTVQRAFSLLSTAFQPQAGLPSAYMHTESVQQVCQIAAATPAAIPLNPSAFHSPEWRLWRCAGCCRFAATYWIV